MMRLLKTTYTHNPPHRTRATALLRTALAALLCMAACIGAWADSQMQMRQIGHADGLSNSAVMAVLKDNTGMMWFGTYDGLNAYDGHAMTVYRSSRTGRATLLSNVIYDLSQANGDNIWISTNLGVNLFSTRTRKCVASFAQFRNYYRLLSDKSGHTWVVSPKSVSYYLQAERRFVATGIPTKGLCPHLCFADDDGALWASYANGHTVRYTATTDKGGHATTKGTAVALDNRQLKYAFAHDGILSFVDADGNLFLYNLQSRMKLYIRNIAHLLDTYGRIMNIYPANDRIYISFLQGQLFALDAQQHYQEVAINSDARIFTTYYDPQQDILWVGTDCQGVMKFSRKRSMFGQLLFSDADNRVNRPVHSMLTTADGSLWMATKGDGLVRVPATADGGYDIRLAYVYYPGFKTPISQYRRDRREYPTFKLLASRYHNGFWIGGDHNPALAFYDTRADRIIPMSHTDTMQYVHDLCEQDASTLWVCTSGTGLFRVRLDPAGRQVVESRQVRLRSGGYPITEYTGMTIEGDSVLWLASRGFGLIRYDIRTARYARYRVGGNSVSAADDVLSMTREGNTFWLGTNSGLVRLTLLGHNRYSVRHIRQTAQLQSDMVHGVLRDDNGRIWISTDRGLAVYNPHNSLMHSYHINNGMDVGEFCDDAYYRAGRGGRLFFGGINGVVFFATTGDAPSTHKLPIKYTSLSVDDKATPFYSHYDESKARLSLSGTGISMELRFAILDYNNTDGYEFAYILKGADGATWSPYSTSATVRIGHITPGDYTLCIRAKTGVGQGSIATYELPITVSPPWYDTWAAYILYIIILAAIVVAGQRLWRKYSVQSKLVWKLRFYESHHNRSYLSTRRMHRLLGSTATLIDRAAKLQRQCPDKERDALTADICDTLIAAGVEAGCNGTEVPHLTAMMPKSYAVERRVNVREMMNDAVATVMRYNRHDVSNVAVVADAALCAALPDHPMRYLLYGIIDECAACGHPTQLQAGTSGNSLTLSLKAPTDVCARLAHGNGGEQNQGESAQTISHALYTHALHVLGCATRATADGMEISVPQHSADTPAQATAANRPTLLLLEQEPDMRRLIVDLLGSQYNVVTQCTIKETVAWLNTNKAEVFVADTTPYTGREDQFLQFVHSIKGTLMRTTFIPILSWNGFARLDLMMKDLMDSYVIAPYGVFMLAENIRLASRRKDSTRQQPDTPALPIARAADEDTDATHDTQPEFMSRLNAIIDRNLNNENLSVALIANEMNMSQRHFYRRFKEFSLLSPAVLVKNRRLERAASMLRDTDMSIQDILFAAGFKSKAYFYKEFAQRYGCTPRDYRDNKAQRS